MHERAKIESESQKLDEYIEQKSILAKRLKEAIKKEQQKANGFGDIHSKAASDGGWETLHQEVCTGCLHQSDVVKCYPAFLWESFKQMSESRYESRGSKGFRSPGAHLAGYSKAAPLTSSSSILHHS